MSVVHEVERPSGISIAYGLWGDANARPMVFAHVLTGVGTAAGPFLVPLVEKGWTVAAPDQRGHGRRPLSPIRGSWTCATVPPT